jgi:hypothetical protein
MEEKKEFIQEAKKSLGKLSPEEVTIDPELKRIEVEGGSIDLEVCKAEKVEKIVFCTIKIHATSVSEKSVIVWPADTFDLPVLWCNATQMPGMNIPLFDFLPMMDIVLWPGYAHKYMTVLNDARQKALDIFGDTVTDKAFDLPSPVAHALSPYRLLVMLTDEGAGHIPEVASEYIQTYIKCWEKAEPLTASEELDFCKRKKEATRKLMKENDPGYPFMVNVFGEDKTRKVFDIVF